MIVTENQLDEWTRGHAIAAQGAIVELVYRLVAASSPRPKERRFPLGDSIGQHGPDGVLDVDYPFNPFIPQGRSYWEIGTNLDANTKATEDYKSLTNDVPEATRKASSFIFVTPRSGRRDWPHTWKSDSQNKWITERKTRDEWGDVRIIDGTKLVDWLRQLPSVAIWLAKQMGLPGARLELPEERWKLLREVGAPPPLLPTTFLSNRDLARTRLREIFDQKATELKLDTHFPDQVGDFVSAFIEHLDEESRTDARGRCVIVPSSDAWSEIADHKERLVLVADFPLNDQDSTSVRLIEKARRSRHGIVLGGRPGGIPHPFRAVIPNPTTDQIRQSLIEAGYAEERARTLAQRSSGNLGSLLRCLQNLSLSPAWAENSTAADLVVAELLGGWTDDATADKEAIEGLLSGKVYGEWIERIREVALRADAPLKQRDQKWNFWARYEGWYALGPWIFNEHLNLLREAAIRVLSELDPKFELPPSDRFAASIHNKKLKHSDPLRYGIAETLALLGGHPKALTSASIDKPMETATLAVRSILKGANWVKWASLNGVMPLLAEASPRAFLDAVEDGLSAKPCPFEELFAQEDGGIGGATYLTGILWGLETVAWSPDHLTRVTVILGELASIDPGGQWANRPSSSLQTIFLPWLPQTCASVAARQTAIRTLISENPEVGWRLLLDLLPRTHQSTMGSRRPEWLPLIPEDWKDEPSHAEYEAQVIAYSHLAIDVAGNDPARLSALIETLADLPAGSRDRLIAHLSTMPDSGISEEAVSQIWEALTELAAKHTRFADADWAMPDDIRANLESVRVKLLPSTPSIRYRQLFGNNDFDLLDEKGSYDEQARRLESLRAAAIQEMAAKEGLTAVFDFALIVAAPWRIGQALASLSSGTIDSENLERLILPSLLKSEHTALQQLAGAFVATRVSKNGVAWADALDKTKWSLHQVGQFLSYLPFNQNTWCRVASWLGSEKQYYWSIVQPNISEADGELEGAIEELIDHNRALAAIQCLYMLHFRAKAFRAAQAIRALLLTPKSTETPTSIFGHYITGLIKALQDRSDVDVKDLLKVEWLYLRLLTGRENGVSANTIQRLLSNSPGLFCEVIRLIYYPRNETKRATRSPDEIENGKQARRLLDTWQIPPGLRDDGSLDGDSLENWIKAVKEECRASDHLEVAMISVGRVLTHSPADPDGLWIHRAAASVLNARDSEDMRRGFSTQLFNSRGVYRFSHGQEELKLAQTYRAKGEAIEQAGFHRLATTMRQLAEGYEADAARDAAREPGS